MLAPKTQTQKYVYYCHAQTERHVRCIRRFCDFLRTQRRKQEKFGLVLSEGEAGTRDGGRREAECPRAAASKPSQAKSVPLRKNKPNSSERSTCKTHDKRETKKLKKKTSNCKRLGCSFVGDTIALLTTNMTEHRM